MLKFSLLADGLSLSYIDSYIESQSPSSKPKTAQPSDSAIAMDCCFVDSFCLNLPIFKQNTNTMARPGSLPSSRGTSFSSGSSVQGAAAMPRRLQSNGHPKELRSLVGNEPGKKQESIEDSEEKKRT